MTLLLLSIVLVIALIVFLVLSVTTLSIQKNVSGPITANQSVSVKDNTHVYANPSVPAAQPATLTVRTSNTVGTLTMTNAGHGITTGQRVDLFFAGGSQYNVTVGTVSGLSVPFSLGTGTNLPAATSLITVGIATSAPFNVVGNNMQGLVVSMGQLPTGQVNEGYFVFSTASADSFSVPLTGGTIYDWFNGYSVAANPLANDTISLVWMSHADTTQARTDMQADAVTH